MRATLRLFAWWRRRFREPVIADRSLDLLAMAIWACYAGWGIATTLAGLPTINQAIGWTWSLLWGGTIGVLMLVAFVAAFSTFFTATNVRARIRYKLVEMMAVIASAGFIALYPLFMIFLALTEDRDRIAASFLAISYVLFPAWRARHLFQRIRVLRAQTSGVEQ